ncbi:hypothetical protein LPJ61_004578 [Coemansia biformis]|uniref:N-acetyltransferase domain-containing protein n=1 Tax=Coemansia biformis TaxID=1286918 RepID=A0A9W7YAI2_9FUNG|nr:hypothetical protein LPJ61_004578 [Coemansia biformis]
MADSEPQCGLLPRWYAESRYLHSGAIGAVSDSVESFMFGQLFMTPSISTFRDGNHLSVRFCHLEYPWDRPKAFADPPRTLPQIVRGAFDSTPPEGPAASRCVVDYTLVGEPAAANIVDDFEQQGFVCERAEDAVMAMTYSSSEAGLAEAPGAVVRPVKRSEVAQLAECNARSFGYDRMGDTAWLAPKLARQLDHPELFHMHAALVDGEITSFASVYYARNLAFVQAVGTRPEHQRQGLAAAALSSALAGLDAGTRVYLDAYEDGPMRMYRRIGFEEVGKITYADCTSRD